MCLGKIGEITFALTKITQLLNFIVRQKSPFYRIEEETGNPFVFKKQKWVR
jgi:hypothetical protein